MILRQSTRQLSLYPRNPETTHLVLVVELRQSLERSGILSDESSLAELARVLFESLRLGERFSHLQQSIVGDSREGVLQETLASERAQERRMAKGRTASLSLWTATASKESGSSASSLKIPPSGLWSFLWWCDLNMALAGWRFGSDQGEGGGGVGEGSKARVGKCGASRRRCHRSVVARCTPRAAPVVTGRTCEA